MQPKPTAIESMGFDSLPPPLRGNVPPSGEVPLTVVVDLTVVVVVVPPQPPPSEVVVP